MLTGSTDTDKIRNFLTGQGLTPEGAAGVMGNLYAESGLNPINLQNSAEKRLGLSDAEYTAAVDSGGYSGFIHDSAGYGMCQWTYWSRKEALLDYARTRGKSIGDLETQLEFMMQELKTGYKGLLETLKGARTVREASDAFLLQFERPADQSEAAKAKRAGYGEKYVANQGGGSAMTETELRNKVVSTINGWMGAKEGSSTHQKILDIYNGHKPLARGYKMGLKDAWCAATVSATWIACGIADYTGTECSCSKFIEIAKSKGTWVESDSYMPKIGDAIIYDWEDSGKGDNTGAPNHIGIVTKVSGTSFVVTEGNKSNKVTTRSMKQNGRYIRGFITPDYKSIAAKLGGTSASTATATPSVSTSTSSTSSTSKPAYQVAQKKSESYNKTWTVAAKAGLHLRWGAGTNEGILTTLKNGTKVRCYGYYNIGTNGHVWLCVVAGNLTGYCDKTYLK